jgi:hypothetical protein
MTDLIRTGRTCSRCGDQSVMIDLTAPSAQWLCDACLQERNEWWRANAVRVDYNERHEPAVEQHNLEGRDESGSHYW